MGGTGSSSLHAVWVSQGSGPSLAALHTRQQHHLQLSCREQAGVLETLAQAGLERCFTGPPSHGQFSGLCVCSSP